MILVTGGTGLLGSHLLYRLTGEREGVRALYRNDNSLQKARRIFSHYPQGTERFNKIDWIKGDILDFPSLEEAMDQVDYLYHCAAVVSFNPACKRKLLKVNFEGTENIVNTALAKGVKKLCYASSVAALGSKKNGSAIDENTVWENKNNPSNYSISKHLAEREVWRAIEEGLPAVIVNPSTIIGPGDWSEGSPALIRQMDEGLKYYTEGQTAFVDVRDVADIMVRLMESKLNREQFILASENMPFKTFFETVAGELGVSKPSVKASPGLTKMVWRLEKFRSKITGREPVITKESAKIAHAKDTYSNKKVKSELNVDFIPVEESIRHACSIYKREKDN